MAPSGPSGSSVTEVENAELSDELHRLRTKVAELETRAAGAVPKAVLASVREQYEVRLGVLCDWELWLA